MSTVAPAQWLGKKPLEEMSNKELCDEMDRYEAEFYRILGNGQSNQRGEPWLRGPHNPPHSDSHTKEETPK